MTFARAARECARLRLYSPQQPGPWQTHGHPPTPV